MKYIYKIVLLSFIIIGITSCDENENFEILAPQGGIAINSPIDGSSIALNDTNDGNTALTVSWTAATIEGTGATYMVEAALLGTDFAAPAEIGTTDATSISLTVKELNTLAIDVLGIDAETEAGIEIRVSSGGEVSQTIAVLLTPYKVEFTEFYLVGSLTGWDPTTSLPMTKTAFNEFEITINLADGDEFKFLPTNIDWTGDFGEDPNNAGTLIEDGEQNLAGYTAGKYKVKVNLNTFTYSVEEILFPTSLYLVGSIVGWDNTAALEFNNTAENVFTLVVNLPAGAEFKFLPTLGSWDGDWGNDPNNSGSLIQTDESNVSGYDAGDYLITVDYNTLTFNLQSLETLNVVGSIVGWDNTAAIPMSKASLGIFSVVLDLPDGAEFKFLPTLGSWDGDWGEDPNNAGSIIQDGENNLSGYSAGLKVVAVNFNTMSFTVSDVSEVPSSLYLVGSFRGWSNDGDDPQFTEISSGVFEISQTFSSGDEFKFVPVAGEWGNDWGESQTSKGVLEQNSENNLSVSEAGNYTVTVNFNDGTVKVN
ncbi:MAG: SusF/SusE family outer membrane protein [Lutibacter sp.]|uniref:SusF/SusE family outer membrane protein n=1 Tax=Lutibacter sp. TaxID=1925666 RepID=UPI00385CE7B9